MLVFPQWRPEVHGGGCRAQRWMNAERFAPYLARTIALPPIPPQFEDEESLGGSSPERAEGAEGAEGACEWRGCGARFASVARLSAHVARVHAHAHRDGLYYCGWKSCSRPQRGFNARYKMLVHVRTHTNERPHTCNQCNKSFSRAENLKIHLRSHSGEKPYICPYEGCGKAYSNSSDRFKHTRTHTVDKPYFCKVSGCSKRYTDPSSLRKHVKTYKHFTDKEPRRDSEDDVIARLSPQKELVTYIDQGSPLHTGIYSPLSNIPSPQVGVYSPPSNIPSPQMEVYSPPNNVPSPQISPYDPMVPVIDSPLSSPYRYIPAMDRATYMRPLEPVYPARVPTNEISYVEYSHMYEHAYRNYYMNSINYPVLRPTITEKLYSYKEQQTEFNDVTMDSPKKITEDKPLNLCAKRLDCTSVQELVKITDLPLDLSTKT